MKISICILAYNAEDYLPVLFESLSTQTDGDFETIIYDDASKDKTADLIRAKGYNLLQGLENRGCSYAKNIMASHAQGEWLFFLDSDDFIYPDFIRTCKLLIKNYPKAEGIILGYDYVDPIKNKYLGVPNLDEELLKTDPIRFTICKKIVNTILIKKELFQKVGGFTIDHRQLYFEDRAYAIKLALNGINLTLTDKKLFRIHFFANSMSARHPERWIADGRFVFEKTNQITNGKYSNEIAQQLMAMAAYAAKYSKWSEVDKCFSLAKKINKAVRPGNHALFNQMANISPVISYWIGKKILSILKPRFS